MASFGAEIAAGLAARGVSTVFGIPGVHNVELYRGLGEAGITHILARHEQGAGFMADGYARASGRPGVAFVITGPGLTNILTPMGQAYSDSVPMLVISSGLPVAAEGQGQGMLHEMRDQAGAARAVAAWSEVAADAPGFWRLAERAFAGFAAARPRPVHIQVPLDRLAAPGAAPPAPGPRPAPPAPVPAAVAEAAARLTAAARPLILLGGGAHGASGDLPALLARTGAAVFPTSAAKGLLGDAAAMSFGATLPRPGSREVLAQADLILALGTELAETDLWRSDPGITAPVIRVDLDPAQLSGGHAELPILADAAAFTAALLPHLAETPPRWDAAEVAATRARLVADALAERAEVAPVIAPLEAALPADAIVTADMTQLCYLANETVAVKPGAVWCQPAGFGTLGYALPAAIGAKVAAPGRPVIALAGDYGFQYTVQELATAVELGLSLPILLWDNARLGEIEDDMIRKQIAPMAVHVKNPDFLALARAYGARAVAPRAYSELPGVLAEAFAAPRPTLIRVTPGLPA
ncbi:MAG: 5-guanidino-2-oxopentanoate decarboxylase [Pseudomonadota bacterium]